MEKHLGPIYSEVFNGFASNIIIGWENLISTTPIFALFVIVVLNVSIYSVSLYELKGLNNLIPNSVFS